MSFEWFLHLYRFLEWHFFSSIMPKTGARYQKERRNSVKKDKEEKRMVCRDRNALCQNICYGFADLSCAWLSHMNKLCIPQEDWKGYFVIATNASAVHCVLQRQPAFQCLLRSLYYPSMPWSFRDRIIFFAVKGNYLFTTKLVLLSTLIEKLDSRASLIEDVSYDRPSWYNCL